MRRARPVVLKLKVASPAMLSGGSTSSVSVTASASTVTVHVSLRWRSLCGSSANVVEGPLGVTVSATVPLVVHVSVKAPAPASTGSLNVTVMFVFVGTSVAPLGGVVAATKGDWSREQRWRGDSVVRGLGVVAVKSALFASVSWQPPSPRKAAVVFDRPGAGAPSK